MQTPTLETERLILRPLTVADAQDIYDRWTSDERVAKYMRWSTHKSVEETKEWLLLEEEGNSKEEHYNWGFALKSTGELIGCGGIFYSKDKCAYELGYNTMYDYWRQGYTTEAAKRMLDFGIQQLGVYEYVCCHAIDNPASGAVMKKCGFEYEKDCVTEKFDGSVEFPSRQYRLKMENTKLEMKKIYFDKTENATCSSVYIKDAEVIATGATVYSMSVTHKNSEYERYAKEYDIHFIFDDNIPKLEFYTIPQIDVFALDSDGGYICSVGQMVDMESNAPIAYVDKNRNCYIVADNGKMFLENIQQWKNSLKAYEDVEFYNSKEEAQEKYGEKEWYI